MNKYEELYKLCKECHAGEQQRFTRLEAKAGQYLAVLTFLIGLAGTFEKTVVKSLIPPGSLFSLLTLGALILAFAGMVASWFLAFNVMRTATLETCPLDEDILHFYRDNEEVDIFYAMSKRFTQAWQKNCEINNMKGELLRQAHRAVRATVVLLVAAMMFSFCQAWPEFQNTRPATIIQTNALTIPSTNVSPVHVPNP